jgi:hypothetical protein
MKFAAGKTQKWLVGLGSGLVLVFGLLPAVAHADQYPYLKEYGADVTTGGWFGSGCVGSQYQYPGYGSTPSALTGGIVTYANSVGGNGAGGSSSEYGAFALGSISTSTGPPSNGFYSGGAQANSSVGRLSFANFSNLGNFGGGNQPSDQCIPDYYDSTQQTTIQALTGNSLTNIGSGQYKVSPGTATPFTLNASIIGSGQNIALYVNGDVYINGNITYQSHGNVTSTPKFALVVLGNIYIDPSVSELDGWYIAQPPATGTATSDDGTIWDCHDGNSSEGLSITSSYIKANCQNQLTINGALTAKLINFDRIGNASGGVSDVNAVSTSNSADGSATTDSNAAEVINYTPDMVLGGPFFDLSSNTPKVESLTSLPPVF